MVDPGPNGLWGDAGERLADKAEGLKHMARVQYARAKCKFAGLYEELRHTEASEYYPTRESLDSVINRTTEITKSVSGKIVEVAPSIPDKIIGAGKAVTDTVSNGLSNVRENGLSNGLSNLGGNIIGGGGPVSDYYGSGSSSSRASSGDHGSTTVTSSGSIAGPGYGYHQNDPWAGCFPPDHTYVVGGPNKAGHSVRLVMDVNRGFFGIVF